MDYVTRAITHEELDIPLSLAAGEGWNPGLSDRDVLRRRSTRIFHGFLDTKPIASLSAVSYGPEFRFLGLYIVKPEHRGKGFGWKLWEHALKHWPSVLYKTDV